MAHEYANMHASWRSFSWKMSFISIEIETTQREISTSIRCPKSVEKRKNISTLDVDISTRFIGRRKSMARRKRHKTSSSWDDVIFIDDVEFLEMTSSF